MCWSQEQSVSIKISLSMHFFIGEQESIYAEILLSNPRQIHRKITDDGDLGALGQVCKVGCAEWKPVDQEEELKDCNQVEKK